MRSERPRILFVSWDGPNQTYLESLFIPQFANIGYPTSILQFTSATDGEVARARRVSVDAGLGYRAVRLAGRVSARAARAATSSLDLMAEVERTKPTIILPRSVVAGGLVIGGLPRLKQTLIYDSDGLMIDERLEFGGWSRWSPTYQVARQVERTLLARAAITVTRTEAGAKVLRERCPDADVRVVGNGKDTGHFRPRPESRARIRAKLRIPETAPVIGYVGTWGPQYLPGQMEAFFRAAQARRPDVHWVILSGQPSRWPSGPNIRVDTIEPNDIPDYIAAFDVGLAFRKAVRSQQAVAPIKVAEYLLCGCPVIASRGIGDLDSICRNSDVVHMGTDDADLGKAVDFLVDSLERRSHVLDASRSLGLAHFDVRMKAREYQAVIEAAFYRSAE